MTPDPDRHPLETRIPPVIVVAILTAAMWGVSRLNLLPAFESPFLERVPDVLFVTGVGIAIAGVVPFVRAGTTVNPSAPDEANELITSGIYRVSRNPMYLGLLLVLLAFAIELGSPLALLLVPLFPLWMNRFQIAPEERALEAKFGDEYRRWCRRVRRWL